jgi:cytochrome c biogenesis protein CcdA
VLLAGVLFELGSRRPFVLASALLAGHTAMYLGVNLIGIPFAVPYFGAIAQILRADLSEAGSLLALAGYNLLYALPFALVILARWRFGARAEGPLRTLNGWMERGSSILVPFLLLGLGALFAADALAFLLAGVPLIQP